MASQPNRVLCTPHVIRVFLRMLYQLEMLLEEDLITAIQYLYLTDMLGPSGCTEDDRWMPVVAILVLSGKVRRLEQFNIYSAINQDKEVSSTAPKTDGNWFYIFKAFNDSPF